MSLKNKNSLACMFSSKSDEWRTPKNIYDLILSLGYNDVCPFRADCVDFVDGLKTKWHGKVFCNPPYSCISDWIDKGIDSILKGDCEEVLFLVPARTDTKWFAKILGYSPILLFVQGRLRFNDVGSAPFPSIFIRIYFCSKGYYDLVSRDNLSSSLRYHLKYSFVNP